MIVHRILYQFHAPPGQRIAQRPVSGCPTQPGLDGIMICKCIPMLRPVRHIVLQYRCHPQSRDAQPLQIVQVIDHSLQIAAVPQKDRIPVQRLIPHPGDAVIAGIPIAETIGHQEVYKIRRGHPLCKAFTLSLPSRLQRITDHNSILRTSAAAPASPNPDLHRTRTRPGPISRSRKR